MSDVIWNDQSAGSGLRGYMGGVQVVRHGDYGRPGLWRVDITGFTVGGAYAVVDDFGTLVRVS